MCKSLREFPSNKSIHAFICMSPYVCTYMCAYIRVKRGCIYVRSCVRVCVSVCLWMYVWVRRWKFADACVDSCVGMCGCGYGCVRMGAIGDLVRLYDSY